MWTNQLVGKHNEIIRGFQGIVNNLKIYPPRTKRVKYGQLLLFIFQNNIKELDFEHYQVLKIRTHFS